jgi:hypothetical protein
VPGFLAGVDLAQAPAGVVDSGDDPGQIRAGGRPRGLSEPGNATL